MQSVKKYLKKGVNKRQIDQESVLALKKAKNISSRTLAFFNVDNIFSPTKKIFFALQNVQKICSQSEKQYLSLQAVEKSRYSHLRVCTLLLSHTRTHIQIRQPLEFEKNMFEKLKNEDQRIFLHSKKYVQMFYYICFCLRV